MSNLKEMSTLAFGNTVYEVVDKQARESAKNSISNDKIAQPNGVASLDNNGKVPSNQLPEIKSYDVGGEELGVVKNGGNVVIEEDGTMTAPGTDLPLQSGEGNNSVVIGDGNNKATGDFSISFGAENMSGCFAYTIIGVDKDNKTYTLDCADGLEVGDIYSANVNYIDKTTTMEENYGQITSIDGNVVSVDNLHCSKDFEAVENFFDDYGIDLEKNIFFILEKPMIGNRKIGFQSQTQGFDNAAFGHVSYAEGAYNKALNAVTHAEGRNNTNTGYGSHTEGAYNKASGMYSHAEGYNTKASGDYSHAEGAYTEAIGRYAHTEGAYNKASGMYSHAEGYNTVASGRYAHAEGYNTVASGRCSHTEGYDTEASGDYSHAEGYYTEAIGRYAHAEGFDTVASGQCSHVQGKYNIVDNDDRYAHIVGNGNVNVSSNLHTIRWDNGQGFFRGGTTTEGADYAEFFEWQDGNPDNEDRVGLLVTLDGEKIRLANEEDEVLGIISGTAAVLGDNYECEWNGKYLTDDFGRVIYDLVEEFVDVEHIEFKEVEKEIVDEGTKETRIEVITEEVKTVEKQSLGFWKHPRLNPDYDPEQKYINRSDRPEWDTVGMLGKLYVRDDGTCQVNGYATVGENGVAIASSEKTNMRVLSRVNENVVRVLLK